MALISVQAFAEIGSIALNKKTLRYGYSYNYRSQHQADDRALRECGHGCVIITRFQGCAALATGRYGRAYGYAARSRKYRARSVAVSFCYKYGGRGCRVRASVCNRGYY